MTAEQLAQFFHESYERLAPQFGYETRKESAKPWADVPEQNRKLMTAVCAEVLTQAAAQLAEKEREIARLQREHWSKGCIVEIASVNPSVSDYVKHWEGRAEAAEQRLQEAQAEITRLKLQYTTAECWWDDDFQRDSAEEHAEELGLKLGETFTLQAATYWAETFEVTAVPDASHDDYACVQISEEREEFETYQELAERLRQREAELEQLRTIAEKASAYCTICDDWRGDDTDGATSLRRKAFMELAEAVHAISEAKA